MFLRTGTRSSYMSYVLVRLAHVPVRDFTRGRHGWPTNSAGRRGCTTTWPRDWSANGGDQRPAVGQGLTHAPGTHLGGSHDQPPSRKADHHLPTCPDGVLCPVPLALRAFAGVPSRGGRSVTVPNIRPQSSSSKRVGWRHRGRRTTSTTVRRHARLGLTEAQREKLMCSTAPPSAFEAA